MKKFLLFLISLFQTIIGIVIIGQFSQFLSGGQLQLGLIIFLSIVSFAFAAVVTFGIRKYEVLLPLIMEVILTPLALFRFIIGVVLSFAFGNEFMVQPYSEELLGSVSEYMIYFEVSDENSLSKTGNLLSMVLFALPVTLIMSYSFWNDIFLCDWASANLNISLPRYNIIIGILLIMFLAGALCVIRSQPTEIETYNAHYKFKNEYTNKKEKRYSEDYLVLTDKSREQGWKKVSGGYESHFTVEMIATVVFSPILFFTYLIGVFAAILSCYISKIHSCIGAVDYDDLPMPTLQRVIHFFFGFVINPAAEKKEKKKDIKEKTKKKYVTNSTKPIYKSSYSKTKYKKKSFKEVLQTIGLVLAWPFIKIWEGLKALGRKIKNGCGSFGEFMITLCTIIFFPIILIYKGLRALIVLIKENCASVGGFFLVLLQIIFFPITLIFKLIQAIKEGELSQEFKATLLVTLLAAVLALLYYFMGKTGFIFKLTFELKLEWFTGFFSQYNITKIIASWFKDAGFILCIILAVVIAAAAIIETILVVVSFVLGLILMLLGSLLQIAYIILIPAGLVLFSLIIYFKNFSENEIFGKLLSLIFIGITTFLVFLYAKELIPVMFPN